MVLGLSALCVHARTGKMGRDSGEFLFAYLSSQRLIGFVETLRFRHLHFVGRIRNSERDGEFQR